MPFMAKVDNYFLNRQWAGLLGTPACWLALVAMSAPSQAQTPPIPAPVSVLEPTLIPAPMPAPLSSPDVELVTRQATVLRAGPDSIDAALLSLPAQTRLMATTRRFGPWLQVQTANGVTGWVQQIDVRTALTAANGKAESRRQPLTPRPPLAPLAPLPPLQPLPAPPAAFPRMSPPPTAEPLAPSAAALLAASPRPPEAPRTETAAAAPTAEDRWLEAQTYRSDSETARRFALMVALERVKLPAAADAAATAAAGEAVNPDPAQETGTGRALALNLLAGRGLVDDVALQYYVNQLGRWLSLESARPDLPWVFAVLDDPAARAYALPGGVVFITRGLLARVDTEAQLAGLLAREIVDVAEGRYLRLLAREASRRPDATPASVVAALAAQPARLDDELAKDSGALLLITRSGLHPEGLAEAIRLTSPNGSGKGFLSALIGPDTLTQRRLLALKRQLDERFYPFTRKPKPRIAQRLAQLTTAQMPEGLAPGPSGPAQLRLDPGKRPQ